MPDKNKNTGNNNNKSKNDGNKDDSKDRIDSLLDAGSESTTKYK